MGSNNLWLQGVSTILNQVVDGVEIEENRFALRNMPWWKYLEAINFASKWTRLKCKKICRVLKVPQEYNTDVTLNKNVK